ncbi:MAG: FtsX-like permease family protein [Pseudomonadota bacterium]|nr:FtsX-like permease family protein [Pseudomonadota bacterium]
MNVTVKMACRNLRRNIRRTVLTLSAIAFSCILLVFMLSFQLGMYDQMIETALSVHTGHIQIQANGYDDNHDMNKFVTDPDTVMAVINDLDGINAMAKRSNGFGLLSSRDRTYGGLVIGIDPLKEANITSIHSAMIEGEYLEPDDFGQALIGVTLAENLKIGIGDDLVVLGQGREGAMAAMIYTVKGLFRTNLEEFDRSTIRITRSDFDETFNMHGAVHEIVIRADSLKRVPVLVTQIRQYLTGSLVALDWDALLPGLVQGIEIDLYGGIIMYVILVIVVAFSILNTFLMAVFERKREFGVLMALGARPGRICRLLLIESLIMTALGLIIGTALGILVTQYYVNVGISIPGVGEFIKEFGIPERMYPVLSIKSILIGPTMILAITMMSAIYPALKAFHIKPVDALAIAK